MKKGAKKGGAIKAEEILKAIVLADSFTKEMRPITLQAPRVCIEFYWMNPDHSIIVYSSVYCL